MAARTRSPDRPRTRRASRGALLLIAALALLAPSRCTVNPATGRSQLSLIGERDEVALGRQNHQQILQTMGSYDNPTLQSYVSGLGQGLARASERPQLPWTFTVVNDPAVNAFALPGGFIYVTRGILAYMNSEGELVGVLGHEIGHVTARHSVEQLSRAQLANMGVALGSVVMPELGAAGLLQNGVGLLLLKYSRDAERQADDLGVRYMTKQGFSPQNLADMLDTLGRIEKASGSSTPDFLATHPSAPERVARLRKAGAPGGQVSIEEHNRFVSRLRDLPWGPDPREGYFDGDTFYHPDLAIQMELPRGWQRQNGQSALQAASPNGEAAILLAPAQGRSPREAAQQFFGNNRGLQAEEPRNSSLGSFPALEVRFEAQAQGGSIVGRSFFVQDGGRIYQLMGYGLASRYRTYQSAIDRSLSSFSRLRDSCRRSARSPRVEVVTARSGMTVADLASGAAVDTQTIALINHLDTRSPLEPGRMYKRVVGGNGCR
jgi:predicted Zn-dependent protease